MLHEFAVTTAMRKVHFGWLSLVVACAAGDEPDADQALRQQNLGETDEEAEPQFQEEPIEPLDLPFILQTEVCENGDCQSISIAANFSQEEMAARAAALPEEEFENERIERIDSAARSSENVLQLASTLVERGSPDDLISIAIYLPEEFFDFGRLRGATDEARSALWAERTEQLRPSQEAVERRIEELGGRFQGGIQLANIVYAQVPADGMAALLQFDGILGASTLPHERSQADGVERRLALVYNADGLQSWGWDGNGGGSANGGAIRFGVIETGSQGANLLNGTHQSFKDGASSTRIRAVRTCLPSCVNGFSGDPTGGHGTMVSSTLLSDYEDGQSATYTTPATRQPRGGTAPEGDLYYYLNASGNTGGTASAINDAVSAGVDIINMSLVGCRIN